MKKSILILISCLCLQQTMAQWTKVYQHPTRKNLNGITFVDSLTGYACGDSGVVLKTVDRGQTWNQLNTGTTAILLSIHFSTPSNGVAVGDTGAIFRTTDAGNSWQQIQVGLKRRQLTKVKFTSPDTGFIAGDSVTMLKTTDGGQSWSQPLPMPPGVQSWAKFLGLHFVNSNLGFGCGGSFEGTRKTLFVKTTDGGLSWDTMASTLIVSTRTGLWDVQFLSPTVGYAAGIFGKVIKTTTAGQTWFTVRNYGGNYLRTLHFINPTTGWVAGSLQGGISFGDGAIKSTTDGGVFWNVESWSTMWTDWTNPGTARISCVTSVNHDSTYTVFAVGREGVIIKNNNLTSNAPIMGDPSELSLFPNPAKDEIEIEIPDFQGALSFRCFNGMGKEMSLPILSESREMGSSRLDVKSLPSGIYFIRCSIGNTTWVKKFLKE